MVQLALALEWGFQDVEDDYTVSCSSPNNPTRGWDEDWTNVMYCDDTSYFLKTYFTVTKPLYLSPYNAYLDVAWYASGTGATADNYTVWCENSSTENYYYVGDLGGTDGNYNRTLLLLPSDYCLNPNGAGSTTLLIRYVAKADTELGFREDAINWSRNQCLPPESGNWEIADEDCTLTSNAETPGNLTLTNANLTLNAYLSFTSSLQEIIMNPISYLITNSGGGIG